METRKQGWPFPAVQLVGTQREKNAERNKGERALVWGANALLPYFLMRHFFTLRSNELSGSQWIVHERLVTSSTASTPWILPSSWCTSLLRVVSQNALTNVWHLNAVLLRTNLRMCVINLSLGALWFVCPFLETGQNFQCIVPSLFNCGNFSCITGAGSYRPSYTPQQANSGAGVDPFTGTDNYNIVPLKIIWFYL